MPPSELEEARQQDGRADHRPASPHQEDPRHPSTSARGDHHHLRMMSDRSFFGSRKRHLQCGQSQVKVAGPPFSNVRAPTGSDSETGAVYHSSTNDEPACEYGVQSSARTVIVIELLFSWDSIR